VYGRGVQRRSRFRCRTFPRGWCGILPFLAFTFACSTATPAPSTPRKLTILFPEGTGDSANNGLAQIVSLLSQEGLTIIAPDGRVQPRLAESLKWSDDGLELSVTLRPNILMHDRKKLDASRAADILRRIIEDPNSRRMYPGLADVDAVKAEGERIIRFVVRRHAAWLPDDLSAPLSVPDPDNPKGIKFGAGPYQIVSNEGNTRVLQRFVQYYGGEPSIERVDLQSVETLRIAWASLLRGEVDMVTDLPPDTVELIRNPNVYIKSFSRNYQYLIAFNGRSRKFTDPRIRRALNMAIDRETIVTRVLKSSGLPATGPIWPKHWAYDPSAGSYKFDPGGASVLLEKSGLQVHASADESLPPARLRLTCLVPARFSIIEQIALEVQRQLLEVGVDIHFDVQPYDVYNDRLTRGDFETVMIDLVGGPSLSRASIMWRSPKRSDALPIFSYNNPVTEALFESLRISSNEANTRVDVRKLQQAFLESPPAIFLAWNDRARAVRSDFSVPGELGTDPLTTLWRWKTDKPDRPGDRMANR